MFLFESLNEIIYTNFLILPKKSCQFVDSEYARKIEQGVDLATTFFPKCFHVRSGPCWIRNTYTEHCGIVSAVYIWFPVGFLTVAVVSMMATKNTKKYLQDTRIVVESQI